MLCATFGDTSRPSKVWRVQQRIQGSELLLVVLGENNFDLLIVHL